MRPQKKISLTVNELSTDLKIVPNTFSYKDFSNLIEDEEKEE